MSTASCSQHPRAPETFRCVHCGLGFCEDCRALDTPEACVSCALSAAMRDVADEKLEVARAPRTWRVPRSTKLVVGLAVAIAIAGVSWLALRPPQPSPDILRSFDDLEELAAAVEVYRESAGQLPESLDPLLPELSPHLAGLVRRGELAYTIEPEGDYVVERVTPES